MDKKEQWYLYHIENGKVVLDRADHTDHHRQYINRTQKRQPKYVAGSRSPLKPEEIAAFERDLGMKFDLSHRQPLPAFEEPPRWKAEREAKRKRSEAERGVK